jgi:hypothetical protein
MGGARRNQGVDPDQTGLLCGGGGAGIEAEPAKPEESGAEHDERDVVRAVPRVLSETVALADDQGQHEGGNAGTDFDDGAAGEVDDLAKDGRHCSALAHEAPAPDHESERAVDGRDPDRHEENPGGELGAVGNRAADEGYGEDREGSGKAGLDQVGGAHEPAQAEAGERVAEQAENALACAHGVAPEHPDDAHDAGGHEAHHDHVEGGLGAGHSAVEEAQCRGHQQHQRCRHHHPNVRRSDFHALSLPRKLIFPWTADAGATPLIDIRGFMFQVWAWHVTRGFRKSRLRKALVTAVFRIC